MRFHAPDKPKRKPALLPLRAATGRASQAHVGQGALQT